MDLTIITIMVLACVFFIVISLIYEDLSEMCVWWMPWSFTDFAMQHLCAIKSGKTGWYDDDFFPYWGNTLAFRYLADKGLITVVSSNFNKVIYLTRRGRFVRWYATHVRGIGCE